MSRYIILLKFTWEGILQHQGITGRAHAFDALAAKSGVALDGPSWTTGALRWSAHSDH